MNEISTFFGNDKKGVDRANLTLSANYSKNSRTINDGKTIEVERKALTRKNLEISAKYSENSRLVVNLITLKGIAERKSNRTSEETTQIEAIKKENINLYVKTLRELFKILTPETYNEVKDTNCANMPCINIIKQIVTDLNTKTEMRESYRDYQHLLDKIKAITGIVALPPTKGGGYRKQQYVLPYW